MIDSEEKKYVAELCASVTGKYPNDVVAFQHVIFGGDSPYKGYFFVKSYFGTGTLMLALNNTTFPSDEKQDMTGGIISNRDYLGNGLFCDEVRIGPGTSNHYVFAGYKCIW